ncbi:MAG TPA: XrtA/PEP-CTERM system histidine kinase PrsK, partial [Lamprocystis sp. (in: g-proteobacteria)]|nr:XrtA/PEP-CTERM system histidine kinase PrsK [Lamprocystis sp. (in: g-proteobacteria)]
LRNLAWILFLIRLLELQAHGDKVRSRQLAWARVAAVALTLLLVSPLEGLLDSLGLRVEFNLALVRLFGALLTAITGLVLVEQVFRNTPWHQRWGVKYLCLGVGGLFAFDFFFYADALLFQRLDSDIWIARGAASALAAPLIGVSAARNPQWSFDLFVSRKVVFHSTTMFAAGIYLLIMSLVGYYIRFYGGEWSSALQTLFFFGAGMVLIILLFSGHLRSRIKVFVNKHFFNYRYDYREEWLHLIDVLSGRVLQASLPERVIFALAELVDSPGGVLWLRTEGRHYEPARAWNLAEDTVDKNTDFTFVADFLAQRRWVINLAELRRDPDAYDGLEVSPGLLTDERLWLIVPLQHDDELLGFVILARPRSPQAVDWEVMDVLKTAARQASSYLALDRTARALAEARQFEGFNRLSAFVVHDLKNLIAQLSLVTKNAERHRQNPAFIDDAIGTIKNSVDKMYRLLAQLRSPPQRGAGARVDLYAVVAEVVRTRKAQEPAPALELPTPAMQAWQPLEVRADADRLAAVISHVVQNAQEATQRDGQVTVRVGRNDTQAVIEVRDTGLGMDAEFIRERLFKPFDSTKGLTGMGVGAYEARELVVSLGGRVVVESVPGQGTMFRFLIPIETTGADSRVTVPAG